MIKLPNSLATDELRDLCADRGTWVWASPRFSARIRDRLACAAHCDLPDAGTRPSAIVVIGGGMRIDRAKLWRAKNAPQANVIAVPSIWGSGAEATAIAVEDHQGRKTIHLGEEFLPDGRHLWPELAQSASARLTRHASGDVWAHALEGFLSPLASDELRSDLAEVIERLQAIPRGRDRQWDRQWFELSALSAAGQAHSSAGLTHGLAHCLEAPLRAVDSDCWGHARLCATLIEPVMRFNLSASERSLALLRRYDLSPQKILDSLEDLSDPHDEALCRKIIADLWPQIIRDPSTRTNVARVRRDSIEFFKASAHV